MNKAMKSILPYALFVVFATFTIGLLSPIGTFNPHVTAIERNSGKKIVELSERGTFTVNAYA
jgi:hypothetical protein